MTFIQLVESESDRFDEIEAMSMEYEATTAGRTTAQRTIVCQDRDNPRRFTVAVFFESYESAMENSNLPETQAFSQKLAGLVDGPVKFSNLDVLSDNG